MLQQISSQSIKPKLNILFWKIIDIIYPPFCCHCGTVGYELCPNCFAQINTIPLDSVCLICGNPLNPAKQCDRKELHLSFFTGARSWGFYEGPLKSALRKIKYDRGFGLISYFVDQLTLTIMNWEIDFDFIVPVALGTKRQLDRGYNQAEQISRPVAARLNKPILPGALVRTRETTSQVGLGFNERRENVKNAFSADENICNGRSILLFDDITTTFSTLNACASALSSAGASSIYCFTVARTIYQSEKEKI